MWLKYPVLLLTFFCSFCLPGQSSASTAPAASTLSVFVSILPQEFFVKRIGGEQVLVHVLVEPGHNPDTYALTPKQMALLATADLYFRVGVPFEDGLMPKINRSIPELKIIDLREGIDLLHLEEAHAEHGEKEGDLDPHTWMDPMLALKQAAHIRDALIRSAPQHETEFTGNYTQLAEELQALDQKLRKILAPHAGRTIYVFHPAYGYFCRAYGLRQKAIQQSGKNPGTRHLVRLIEEAAQDRVRVIFVQPQFSIKSAETIAKSINGRLVTMDPLARDYLANMEDMARQLADILSE